jgi:uncharacterized transporter YbjL
MTNKVKEIFKKGWNYVYETKIGKLIASFLLASICLFLSEIWDFMYYVAMAFMAYPFGLMIVMIAYAWVINPMKDWKESQNAKKMAQSSEKTPSMTEDVKVIPETAAITQKLIEIEELKSPGVVVKEVVEPKSKKVEAVKKAPAKKKTNELQNKLKKRNNKK